MKKIIFVVCTIFYFSSYLHSERLQLPHLTKPGNDNFHHWLRFSTAALKEPSHVAHTDAGPIEYVKQGKGPVVLSLHGAFGGYDQGLLISGFLIGRGFTVLSPSRPGYLRTPLSVGSTAEQQADAMAALLDTLGIKKVAVLGFSAGAPVAFQFALRHPKRVSALVMECVGAQPADAPIYTIFNAFLELGPVSEFGPWSIYTTARYYPKTAAKVILPQDTFLKKEALYEREEYVIHHKKQLHFFQRFVYTTTPFNPRRLGVINDISAVDPWPTYPLASLNKPSMLLQAKADSNGSYSEAITIASKIPGCKLVTIHGSGHFIWLGKETNEWEKKLVHFLKKHEPGK